MIPIVDYTCKNLWILLDFLHHHAMKIVRSKHANANKYKLIIITSCLLIILLGSPCLAQNHEDDFSIYEAKIKFNLKKSNKDKLTIVGSLQGLSTTENIDTVKLVLHTFSQDINIDEFKQKKDKLIYKGKKGDNGISKLILDHPICEKMKLFWKKQLI